jgi:zinc transport system permease protein
MVSSLAIGTFVNALVGGNADVDEYLFGDIMMISGVEVWAALGLVLAIIGVYALNHNKIFAITYDEKFARAIGVNTKLYNAIFAVLCSVLIVLGMKLMGALLISGLVVFPTLTAQTIFKNFKSVTIFSAVFAVINFVVGLMLSYVWGSPAGATVIIVNLIVLIALKIANKIIKR